MSKNILLVEDTPSECDRAESALRELGHAGWCVKSLPVALIAMQAIGWEDSKNLYGYPEGGQDNVLYYGRKEDDENYHSGYTKDHAYCDTIGIDPTSAADWYRYMSKYRLVGVTPAEKSMPGFCFDESHEPRSLEWQRERLLSASLRPHSWERIMAHAYLSHVRWDAIVTDWHIPDFSQPEHFGIPGGINGIFVVGAAKRLGIPVAVCTDGDTHVGSCGYLRQVANQIAPGLPIFFNKDWERAIRAVV